MADKLPIDSTSVQEFVGVAHGDLDRVHVLLAQEPALLNAAWDWGGGDWETALGAAAHMGRRDIALYLIERGARIDIFAAAMLGRLEVLTALLALQPDAWRLRGPHGIPLVDHARAGGEDARTVVDFLLHLEAQQAASAEARKTSASARG